MVSELLKKAEILTEHDPAGKAVTFNNFACFSRQQGRLHASLAYLQKALGIEQKLAQVDTPADTHLNLCAVLSQLGRHREALEHSQQALMLLQEELFAEGASERAAQKPDRVAVLAICYHNIGVECEFLKHYQASLQAYTKGVEIASVYLGATHGITQTLERSQAAARGAIDKQALKRKGGAGGTPQGGAPPAAGAAGSPGRSGRRGVSPRASGPAGAGRGHAPAAGHREPAGYGEAGGYAMSPVPGPDSLPGTAGGGSGYGFGPGGRDSGDSRGAAYGHASVGRYPGAAPGTAPLLGSSMAHSLAGSSYGTAAAGLRPALRSAGAAVVGHSSAASGGSVSSAYGASAAAAGGGGGYQSAPRRHTAEPVPGRAEGALDAPGYSAVGAGLRGGEYSGGGSDGVGYGSGGGGGSADAMYRQQPSQQYRPAKSRGGHGGGGFEPGVGLPPVAEESGPGAAGMGEYMTSLAGR
jgi:hypothetical protein